MFLLTLSSNTLNAISPRLEQLAPINVGSEKLEESNIWPETVETQSDFDDTC